MRKFSGITTIQEPEAMTSDNMPPVQMMVNIEKEERKSGRTVMNIQPYRTEFRNMFK